MLFDLRILFATVCLLTQLSQGNGLVCFEEDCEWKGAKCADTIGKNYRLPTEIESGSSLSFENKLLLSPACVCPFGMLHDIRTGSCKEAFLLDRQFVTRTSPLYIQEQDPIPVEAYVRSRPQLPTDWICNTLMCQGRTGNTVITTLDVKTVENQMLNSISFRRLSFSCITDTTASVPLFDSTDNPLRWPSFPEIDTFCAPIAVANQTQANLEGVSVLPTCFVSGDKLPHSCSRDEDCGSGNEGCYFTATMSTVSRSLALSSAGIKLAYPSLHQFTGMCACKQGNTMSSWGNCYPDYFNTPQKGVTFGKFHSYGVVMSALTCPSFAFSSKLGSGAMYIDVSMWNDRHSILVRSSSLYAGNSTWRDAGLISTLSENQAVLWRCIRSELYFRDVETGDHCRGVAAVCGSHSNHSLSVPETGTCSCLPGWTGSRCDKCVGTAGGGNCEFNSASECSEARCNGHGQCSSTSPGACTCDSDWYGASCELPASGCAVATCAPHLSSSSFADPQLIGRKAECVFDRIPKVVIRQVCKCIQPNMFGANCEQTAEQCSLLRCSGRGSCVTDSLWRCNCPAIYGQSHDCSVVSECKNGGNFNENTRKCECLPMFVGEACEFNRCFNVSNVVNMPSSVRWDVETESCDCGDPKSAVTARDSIAGTCRLHNCGPFGTPSSTWETCLCREGFSDIPKYAPNRCVRVNYNLISQYVNNNISAFQQTGNGTAMVTTANTQRKTRITLAIVFGALIGTVTAAVALSFLVRHYRRKNAIISVKRQ